VTRHAFLLPATVAIAAAMLFGSCVSKRVEFVPFLRPTGEASLDELVRRINESANVRSVVLRVELQFETVEEAERGEGRKYHSAKGRLLLERPRYIRLSIEAPILSANIAEMASDGKRFQLLIYPPEYRALIEGSNDRLYLDEMKKLETDPKLAKAGPLLNIRPQHFVDAFLPAPIDSGTTAFLNEELVTEPDRRPGAKKGAQVRKSYYVVTAVDAGATSPRAQFWFDRLPQIALVRQRVFDDEGRLVTDVHYEGFLPPDPATSVRVPARVRIERPYDEYTLAIDVQREGVLIGRDLPLSAFELTVPPEWQGNLRHIDLDQKSP
jgi:hypothetical protein